MLTNMGAGGFGTYIFFASFCFVMAGFVYFVLPETKGLSLEAMNELWGLPGAGAPKDIEDRGSSEEKRAETEKEGGAEIREVERR
jgi:hypothetical protein